MRETMGEQQLLEFVEEPVESSPSPDINCQDMNCNVNVILHSRMATLNTTILENICFFLCDQL